MSRQQCAFLEESSKFKGCGEKDVNFQEEFKTIFRILGCDVVETQRNIVKGLEGEAYVRGIIKEGFQTDRIKH